MKRFVQRLDHILSLIEKSAVLICFSLLVLVVLSSIFSRNVFHLPSHRLFESAPNLVLWLALLGASLALRHQRHIRLELVLRFCTRRVVFWANQIVNLFGALVMGILLIAACEFVTNEIAMFGNWGWLAVIFPFFFAAAGFRYLSALLLNPLEPASKDSRHFPVKPNP